MHIARRSIRVSILAIAVGVAVAGCKAQISKEDMQTTAAWSSAICDCAKKSGSEAKTCAAALKKPNLDTIGSWWHGGGLKYSLESLKPYDEIMTIGQLCEATIPVGAR